MASPRKRAVQQQIGFARFRGAGDLLHDLGKYSDEFQVYLKSTVGLLNQDEDEEFVDAKGLKGKVDHSTAGAQLVWTELAKHGQLGEIVGQALALCIASHHSGLIDCLTSDVRSLGRCVRQTDEREAIRTHSSAGSNCQSRGGNLQDPGAPIGFGDVNHDRK